MSGHPPTITRSHAPTLPRRLYQCILTAFIVATGLAFFLWIQRVRPGGTDTRIGIDDAIPFLPATALVYIAFFPAMPAVALILDPPSWRRTLAAGVLATLAACVVFAVWPTQVPRPAAAEIAPSWREVFRWVHLVDNGGNACPSLHVALSVIFAAGAVRSGRPRAAAWTAAGLMILSALLTKQHTVMDAVGGLLLGAGGWRLTARAGRPGTETGTGAD